MLEKTLESPLDFKEIKPVNPKGNQFWIFIGRTDAEAETPILWPSDVKNRLIGKDPDAGKDWKWEEKGTTEDEMVGWHHQPNRHEFEWAPGVDDAQGSLACCSPWGHKESDMTEWLNWTEYLWLLRLMLLKLYCVYSSSRDLIKCIFQLNSPGVGFEIPNFFKLQVMLILLVHGAYLGNKILNCCVGSIWRIVWTHEERAAGPNSDACPGNKGNVKWLWKDNTQTRWFLKNLPAQSFSKLVS